MTTVAELEAEATHARLLVLRMLRAGGSGHLGGALSCIDVITALYFRVLRTNPADPRWPGRDRFLLSAGHKAMAQYAVLARRGFFDASDLDSYGGLGSAFTGHPDMHKIPGVEANTGALGHGLPIACGMALGLRMDGRGGRVFTILGDGELPEGSNWEGASIAAHHRLDNLVAIVDINDLQISGRTADVMKMEPIADKFAAFGWSTISIDGNNMSQIVAALEQQPAPGQPTAILARTVKAKGLTELEDTAASHYWKPTAAQLLDAEAELHARLDSLGDLTGAHP
ncbi:transketolase [Streptomyces gilvus]|uniref:transketolase n=1 Tax=Streptomyces gilvus TaxID=2920937 RepID=UPI001F114E9B|nr:transketolase [Streptomyces sp. CME 23]MCH5677956.1 transketolase [Streptomyces sp. CME 23]